MASRLELAAVALLAVPASAEDRCLALDDVAERIVCYAAEDASGSAEVREPELATWRIGEENDPITDETSVVLRRHAEAPHRDEDGILVLPSLTLTCYRGLEVLLSLEARETLAEGTGSEPSEIRVTYRIGTDPPTERAWSSSAPDYRDAYLDRHEGALILAGALAEEDPGEALFRYRTAGGATRTVKFGLEALATLLPRLQQACGAR